MTGNPAEPLDDYEAMFAVAFGFSNRCGVSGFSNGTLVCVCIQVTNPMIGVTTQNRAMILLPNLLSLDYGKYMWGCGSKILFMCFLSSALPLLNVSLASFCW